MNQQRDFFSGVLQMALGIALGGLILFGLAQIYVRYELQGAVEALKVIELPTFSTNSNPPTIGVKPGDKDDAGTPAQSEFAVRCHDLGISVDQCRRVIELRKGP